MVTSTPSTSDVPMISKTSIWRTGHGSGSVFIDMTGRKESKIEFLHLVAQQYPSRVGVLTQQVGTLKFAEINFAPDDDALSECLANGISFADKSTILPCRALDTHMQVVRLRLSNLPFLNEKDLMKGLEKSLRKYGDILDVGILLEPTTGTYMCTGYAVLNVTSKTETFEPLTHLIPWDEQRECGFYAVWNQMPVYCRYCHEEGHVVANCPKLQSHNVPPEVMPNDVCTPDEVSEELMEDLMEPDAQNNMSEPLDTTVPVDVPAPTLNIETASKHSVKRQKKDRRPTPYVLPATRSKSTLLKAQLPTPEQDESVDNTSSITDTAHLDSSSSVKSNNTNKQSKFIRYLRSLNFDIMTFQETHVSDNILSLINTQFQAQHSLWSRHCGIVSFSPSFVFSTNLTPENDRTILTKVTHPHNAFAPFYVLVIYAPATSGQHRSQFFDQLFDLLHSPTLDINLDRLVITGDFNYSYQRPHLSSQTSLQWVSFLDDHFYNALQKDDLHELPTFRRNDNILSTIDYIFVSQSWCSKVTESNIHKLDASWSDHSLLSITCCIGSSPSGPGLWRGNPLLARNPAYQQYLRQHLEYILPKLPSEWSAAKSWDHIKRQVKKITRTFAVDYTNWRTKTIRKLQSNRNRFLRSKPPLAIRLHQLPIFDQQIASLQQELTDILALKANVRWQEAGETSIKYLKSMYRKRTVEQHITTLRSDDNEDPVEGIDQLLPITQQFYQSLYDADPVDDLQLDSYLQAIFGLPQVISDHCDILMAPITIDEIIQETARVKNKISSPGEDGLGYAFLYQLFRYPPLQELVLKSSQLTNAAGDTIPDQPMSNWVYAESLYRGKWSRT
ncbi:hypothetical protein RO3G_03002 [Rhizopus delemar RA 99-880]|uniref:Endonuclease/exonuclease/phosphatase domain-containing protein n=1 Tax=Rhizopus delemar (strain RA 99-880 / ATCC MYA-4621 / FGSC 9543 / NRRL 43880) TaxID=246409 RepID=I1BQ18_RHIO9|nr:hypothetical protein RO3G_03002 [Rhizopus delemar RA 99-880]|eukprot:EIE78298.1 hypothetical protein RO3G_03002 [Rhizopus delemar RA 99-880]